MIFSEDRKPPRIKRGAGFFGIMLSSARRHGASRAVSTSGDFAEGDVAVAIVVSRVALWKSALSHATVDSGQRIGRRLR